MAAKTEALSGVDAAGAALGERATSIEVTLGEVHDRRRARRAVAAMRTLRDARACASRC